MIGWLVGWLSQEEIAAQKAALKGAYDKAAANLRKAEDDFREHQSSADELLQAYRSAKQQEDSLMDLGNRKMQLCLSLNKDAAKLGKWIGDEGIANEEVIGPLLMHIDVPKVAHQPLVEQAIGSKYATAYLATSDSAQKTVNKAVADHSWKVNVYRTAASAYVPGQRPEARLMKKWGVDMWLDEALAIPPEHRDQILSALKDLNGVDRK